MLYNSVAHLPGKVESFAMIFQKINDPQTLVVMLEPTRMQAVETVLSGMTKGRMAKVMAKCNGLGQVFI